MNVKTAMIGYMDPLSPEVPFEPKMAEPAAPEPAAFEPAAFEPAAPEPAQKPADPRRRSTSTAPIVDQRNHRTEEIPLDSETSILVEISDALSEREKVKYTIRSQTKLPDWKEDYSVVREHDEFMWLHSSLDENEAYAALIIPPPPPKPSFETSQAKLQKLATEEHNMTKEEAAKAKQDLEQEYLALFKKTVAMHEVYLQRLAAHPVIGQDNNFKLFLQYDKELAIRGKNTKEVMGALWKKVTSSADQIVLTGSKDPDYQFELQRSYIVEYNQHISEAANWAEKVVRLRKRVADIYSKLYGQFDYMSRSPTDEMLYANPAVAETFNKMRKAEMKSANDEELKLADTLSYFTRDTQACKDLFYRRLRCLANFEAANKNLDRARTRGKDIEKCEADQAASCQKFEDFSTVAKTELLDFKKRRVAAFGGNIKGLVQLEIKNQKAQVHMLQECLDKLKEVL